METDPTVDALVKWIERHLVPIGTFTLGPIVKNEMAYEWWDDLCEYLKVDPPTNQQIAAVVSFIQPHVEAKV